MHNSVKDHSPPGILLGGGANALSLARSLGQAGIKVYALNHPWEYVRYSRYCTWLRVSANGNFEKAWAQYLLGKASDPLRGAVLLAASDHGIEILSRHRSLLEKKFILDLSNPGAQERMLNKLATFQEGIAAGVPTPKFWLPKDRSEILAWKNELVFPLLVKPLFSHLYQKKFVKKFVIAQNLESTLTAFDQVQKAGIESMLVEMIPGPDDLLCSYYTYLDEQGNPQFHFTKRVIRRFPVNMGGGCYHITDWIPEARDLGLKLFQKVGLRGLGNVEFKRDTRDGQLKLIECNARFTAANGLVTDSGFDLGLFVYNRLTGKSKKPPGNGKEGGYANGKRLWYPLEDFHAFRELHKRGELSLGNWLSSLLHPQTLPHFRWYDPFPTLVTEGRRLRDALARRFSRKK